MYALPVSGWMHDPFAALGLRWNPFRTPTSEELAELAVCDLDVSALAARLRKGGFAVELLGPCGHGKTTHMDALHAHFPRAPRTLLRPDARPPRIPRAPVVFLDESQRLPAWRRRRLFRRRYDGQRVSFVLATHRTHREELAAAGVDALHHEVGQLGREAFSGRLRAIVDRRLAWAADDPSATPRIEDAELARLQAEHGEHLRAILDALYDGFQKRVTSSISERGDAIGQV